jgi:hypothetical protein
VILLTGSIRAQPHDDMRFHHRDRGEWIGRISGIVADCERRTDEFKVALARTLNHSRLDGSRREDQLNADAARLERAMNRLRESWNRHRDPDRSRKNVREAIGAARDINRTMLHHQLRGRIQGEWDVLRGELNRLAEVFDEPKIVWER